jgi:transcriptional regulator with XRE-family HTH domain
MKIIERCEKFARRLVEARETHGLRAKDVASQIGVNVSTMSRFENGVRTPGVLQIRMLAEIMPVNLHWLITGRGPSTFRAVDEEAVAPFGIIRDDHAAEGRILVPGGEGAEQVYQVQDMFMSPRINENDYVFIDREEPSVGDLVVFRDESYQIRVGWLRKIQGEKGIYLVAENPENGRVLASKCDVLGRVICSVKVDRYL